MRTLILTLAAAGSALAIAAPASAQHIPLPQAYGQGYGNYGQNYGQYGYGQNAYGQVRALQARIDSVQYQLSRVDRRGGYRNRSADSLRKEARSIEHRLRDSSRNGLNPYEANDISRRVAMLEQRVNYALAQGNGRYGYGQSRYNQYGNGYGYNSGTPNGAYADRDHDNRDDRYEDDRGDDHDD